MKTLLRAAAIAVASTALVAGGAVTTSASAAPGDTAAVTGITLQPAATYKTSGNVVAGNITVTGGVTTLRADVLVNGVLAAQGVELRPGGFYYNRAWGAGTVSLTNFIASGQDAQGAFAERAVPGPGNAVLIRYAVHSSSNLKITKRGKKLTMRLKARYIDKAGKSVGVRKATIQVKKSGKWKTLKNVSLKSNGTRTYKTSSSKKRYYRMLIKDTSLYVGGTTRGSIHL